MKFVNQPWYRWCWIILTAAVLVIATNFTFKRFLAQPILVQFSPTPQVSSPVIPSENLPSSSPNEVAKKTKYGHFPYAEADRSNLITIASYAQQQYQRFEQLDRAAALALMKMIYAARDEGIWIIPVSGFRDIVSQELLFKKQIQKRGSAEAAAKLSAPPGYSEHHTGYAIDLADGSYPKKDVTYEFENTNAYRWLTLRAKDFGFEMSFTANNSQGVSYEPWHWRFVGSPDATKIFEQARTIQ